MEMNIWIDEKQIKAYDFKDERIHVSSMKHDATKISFSFKVSSEEYHDIAVLLYKNNFQVKVPERKLDFSATIHNYSTDRTDLYKTEQVAVYYLELIEKPH